MMNRDDILSLLREHKATLARRYGVTDIALFGSVARNRTSEHSDIDLLVRSTARRHPSATSACSSTSKISRAAPWIWSRTRH